MAYTWLLFDADGTLFDYDRAEAAAMQATFGDFGLPYTPVTLESYHEINSGYWKQFERGEVSIPILIVGRFADLFARLGLVADPSLANEHYLDNLSRQVFLISGAEAVIPALAAKYHLAVLTNGVARVQRGRLARSPIGKYFEVLVISEEVGASKPGREYFTAAFALLGNPPKDEVLMIGDNPSSDIAGAQPAKAGFETSGATSVAGSLATRPRT